jgi:hypothetical protein
LAFQAKNSHYLIKNGEKQTDKKDLAARATIFDVADFYSKCWCCLLGITSVQVYFFLSKV